MRGLQHRCKIAHWHPQGRTSQQHTSGARSVERSCCSRPRVSNESVLNSICTALNPVMCAISCISTAPIQGLQCWVVTCSVRQPCAGGTSGCKELCKRALLADPAAPAAIDSQHVSNPTPMPASLNSRGRSRRVVVHQIFACQPLTKHTAQSHFMVLHDVHAQQHCPKPRVELGNYLQVRLCRRRCRLLLGRRLVRTAARAASRFSHLVSAPLNHHSCRCDSLQPFVTSGLCHIGDAVQVKVQDRKDPGVQLLSILCHSEACACQLQVSKVPASHKRLMLGARTCRAWPAERPPLLHHGRSRQPGRHLRRRRQRPPPSPAEPHSSVSQER